MLIKYKLRNMVDVYKSGDTAALVCGTSGRTLTLSARTLAMVRKLEAGWLTDDEAVEGGDDLSRGYFSFIKMQNCGMLDARISKGGRTAFFISPSPGDSAFKKQIESSATYQLSRYAYLRRSDGALLLESPLTPCRIKVCDAKLAGMLHQLCSGMRLDIAGAMEKDFLSVLVTSSFAEISGEDVADNPMDYWEFHDLLFHARTLGGKNAYPQGGTYRFQGKRPSLPALKEPASNKTIDLREPSDALLERLNQPFKSVLANRRSKRDFTEGSLTLDELSAFLYASAYVENIQDTPEYEERTTQRPAPSGGARHALEIYPFIRECDNIEPGPYRYDPNQHRLERVVAESSNHEWLLEDNPFEFLGGKAPQITLNISARIGRTAWKYESIAYKLINQDMGCLYQTFYLVATALDLAPCALGSVDARRLGETHGVDWREEPFIGAFTLGK